MAPVAGHLGTGAGYNASAMIEPRMWKTAWKGGLYSETVAQLTQIRLDILMLGFALAGSDGKPDGIFEKFEKANEWKACQDDLNNTLIDAQTVIIGLLSDDKGGFDPVSKLKTVHGVDTLDELPNLIAQSPLTFPSKVGDTMEDDEVCQVASAFLLLETTISHIAGLIQIAIKHS